MKKTFYWSILMLFVIGFSSCNNDECVETEKVETEKCVGTQEFISDLRSIVKDQTRGSSENIEALLPEIIEASIKYLEANGISYTEFYEDRTDPRIAVIAMGTAEYFKQEFSGTRGSLGGCTLQALGVKELVKGGMGSKAVVKVIGKAVAKKAVPYVGWGLFAGELVWCLID